MTYCEFRTCRSNASATSSGPVLDVDGSSLYETDHRPLLLEIIRHNDIPKLIQYISVYSTAAALAPGEVYYYDPFWVAATHGSAETLHILLEQHRTTSTPTVPLDKRGFTLLNAACSSANIEVVRYILDSQPPLGTISARDRYDETAVLSAAASLAYLKFEDASDSADTYGWIHERIAQGEQLINLLLDRGASAQDAVFPFHRTFDDEQSQARDTVLGLAVSRSSYTLVSRLLDEGADLHMKHQHIHHPVGVGGFGREKALSRDVTALHLACLFWNAEAVKALLDRQAANATSTSGPDITDLVSSHDSNGRLPFHWAAAGHNTRECLLPDDEVSSRVIETFSLLLAGCPSAINVQDKEGATPLFYAIGSHAVCCGSKHTELIIRFLLEHGADASVADDRGHTVLHILAYRSAGGEAISTTLIDLLVSHGASVSHADNDGNTALHIMATNIRQVQAAKSLLDRGADVHATNRQRDTAFHGAARGIFQPRETRNTQMEEVDPADRIRAQDEIMRVLQEACRDENMMDRPNAAGRTPRQLQSETRARWQGVGEPLRRGTPGGLV